MDKEVETFGSMKFTAAVRSFLFSIVPFLIWECTIVTIMKMQVLSVHDAAAGDDNDDLLAKYIYGKDDY